MITNKKNEIEILKPEIPAEIKEIIRQHGIILETYKLIVLRWSTPAMVYKSKEE